MVYSDHSWRTWLSLVQRAGPTRWLLAPHIRAIVEPEVKVPIDRFSKCLRQAQTESEERVVEQIDRVFGPFWNEPATSKPGLRPIGQRIQHQRAQENSRYPKGRTRSSSRH